MQLSELRQLRELRLKHVQEPSEGYTRLSTLSALSRLHLHDCQLPCRDALAELHSLRVLSLSPSDVGQGQGGCGGVG